MAYPFNTTVQNIDAVRFGSAQIAICTAIGTTGTTEAYVDLGVAQGVTFKEEITRAWIGGDNAKPQPRIVKQRAIISGTLVEYDSSAWETMRGGIDLYTTGTFGVAGPSSRIMETGGKRTQTAFQTRLINSLVTTSATSRFFQIHAWKCYDNSALEFAFQPDEDENPMGIPFEFVVVPAASKAVGTKLYRIKDSQSTS